MDKARVKLTKIHDGLEQILYNAQLAMNQGISPERMVEINNMIQALEKATMNLRSTVTLEARTAPEQTE